MYLFVDTWGWISLQNRREPRHRETSDYFREFQSQGGRAVTSDYVIDEAITLIYRRVPPSNARLFVEKVRAAIRSDDLRLERIDETRFERALSLRLQYHDKPEISFTDLTSMVVMAQLRIVYVMTADEHFHHIGMGFRSVP